MIKMNKMIKLSQKYFEKVPQQGQQEQEQEQLIEVSDRERS